MSTRAANNIVTFYSYKGGVGRSMAMANIAVLLAQRGLRVLAVAHKQCGGRPESLTGKDVVEGFEMLGLVGIMDPPRTEAVDAIARCKEAGIRVKMMILRRIINVSTRTPATNVHFLNKSLRVENDPKTWMYQTYILLLYQL